MSRGNQPLRQLTLLPGFAGKYIEAAIRPKHNISDPGPETVAISAKPIAAARNKSHDNRSRLPQFCRDAGHRLRERDVDGARQLDFVGGRQPRQRLRTARGVAGRAASLSERRADRRYARQGRADAGKDGGPGIRHRGLARRQRRRDEIRRPIFSSNTIRARATAIRCASGAPSRPRTSACSSSTRSSTASGIRSSDQQQLTGVFKPNTTITLSIAGDTFTATGSNTADGETLSLKGTIVPNRTAARAWPGPDRFPSATAWW